MLTAGNVTVDDAGAHTGDGLALALYEAQLATMAGFLAAINPEHQLTAKRGIATFCTALAAGIVPYFTTNAQVAVTIGAGDGALQRTPSPNNPNTDTQGPSGFAAVKRCSSWLSVIVMEDPVPDKSM